MIILVNIYPFPVEFFRWNSDEIAQFSFLVLFKASGLQVSETDIFWTRKRETTQI